MKEIPGDILTPAPPDDPVTLVCHQVNCQGVMGSGLAKQIRERFPAVFELYSRKCAANALFGNKPSAMLGDIQCIPLQKQAGYTVVNIFGQNRYGRDKRYTDYKALRRAFSTVAEMFPGATVRVPYKFGCGFGGGDWNTVLQIIKDELEGKVREVEIWRLEGADT